MFPKLYLDSESGLPLYRQLYDQIRESIESGRLPQGTRLPATRELAGLLNLNRTTISAAYEALETDGWIKGHVGRGSFVSTGVLESSATPTTQLISFATSRPSAELFPLEAFQQTAQEVIGSPQVSAILQLGSPLGYTPLRQYLLGQARRLQPASEDDVLVTNGCQQALDLLQRSYAAPGEAVIVEDPVYPGLKNVFERAGVRLIGIPVGEQGIDIPALEQALRRERPRLLLVTPNFQNPTGACLSLQSRRDILRLASTAGVPIVENDIYGDLRYSGEALPSLKHLDQEGNVVLIRSFSKIAFPGLRVGWIQASQSAVRRLTESKQSTDLHTDQLSQAVLLRFAESGRLQDHLKKMLAAGRQRLAAMLDACATELPQGTRFTRPVGGMNLWVQLPQPLDAAELLPRVQRRNVTYLPGRFFSVSRYEPGSLRLCFAGLSPEDIRAGVSVLGSLFRQELQRTLTAAREEPATAMV